ncbi:MAG: hypothetical protein PUB67_00060 [Clostridiales bacterium]|nr:hypothetical protein [Clostridiales bacterium]
MDSRRSEKFDYEVKDFEPVIRKNPARKEYLTIAVIVALLCVAALGFYFYKAFIYREKVSPETAVDRAVTDFKNHIFGKDNYISKDVQCEKWYDYTAESPYLFETSLKIKNADNLPIDNIEVIKGVGLKTKSYIDKKNSKFMGEMTASWTLFSIPVLQYMKEEESFYVGSNEFFEESLLVMPGRYGIFSTPIEELAEKYLNTELPDTPINGKTISGIIEEVTPTLVYRELEDTKKFTAYGREVTGYGYEIRASVNAYSEPLMITLYVDKDYRLLSCSLNFTDKTHNIVFDVSFDFTGETHPADKIKLSVSISVEDKKAWGELTFANRKNNDTVTTECKGFFNIPGIDYTFSQKLEYILSENSLHFEGTYSDGADVLEITSGGSVENNTEEQFLKISLDKFTVTYSDKLIFTVNMWVKISEVGSDFSGINRPDGKIIDVFNMTDEEKASLEAQINGRIDYYKKLLREMMGK